MTTLTRGQALSAAAQIRDETAIAANTSTRVGTLLSNLIDSTVFVGEAQTPPTAGNGLSGTNVFSVVADGTSLTVAATGVKISDITGPAFLGRAANSSGAVVAISGTADQVARVSSDGTTLAFGTVATAGLANTAVTMAKLANLVGPAVIGRAANSTGVPAAITATVAGQSLIFDGTSLAFGSPNFAALDLTTTGNVLLGPAATRPSTGLVRIGGSWAITAQSSAPANVNALTWDNTTNILLMGGGAGAVKPRIQGSSNVELNIGGTTRMVLGSASFLAFLPELGWDNTVALPVLDQQGTVGATGQLMTIQAQNAATTGGALNLASGTGGTAGGEVSLSVGNVKRFRANGTGVAFFAVAPVAQQTLTDSTGGTPGTALVDVGAVFSQANLNNNFASIRQVLNRYGLAA